MKLNLYFLIAVVAVLSLFTTELIAAVPTNADISWTASAGIQINQWLAIEEDYGSPAENTILEQTENSIVYRNSLVIIHKQWKLKGRTLIITEQIEPLSEDGLTSELVLRINTLRNFDQFYTPYAFSSPKISGKWIKSNDIPRIECGYHGAYSNSMKYTILHDSIGAVMMDRVMSNGYLVIEGGIKEAEGDFSRIVWPMLSYGRYFWNPGLPKLYKEQKGWQKNVYPKKGGSVEYQLHFFDKQSPAETGSQANTIYLDTRRQIKKDLLYQGWEGFHREPEDTIGFFALVGGDWGELAHGGTGILKQNAAHYLKNLKDMREILDDNGMSDAKIYFWVMNWDSAEDVQCPDRCPLGGWGIFPHDAYDLKAFYEQLRAEVHDIKLGLYVNFWLCSVQADVYKQHPEWFSNEYHTADAGGAAYAGKLPFWGDHLAGEMPGLLKAYDLDFIFFDGADWATHWRGTNEQCREFYMNISKVMHENSAEFVANTSVPFVDMGMFEYDAGESDQTDRDLANNFKGRTFHNFIFSPFFAWRSWQQELVEASGQSMVKNFSDKPGFITRWPVHYRGEANEHIMKDFFTPFVKKRSAVIKK